MRIAALAAVLSATAAWGEVWQPLDGAGIAEALTDRTLDYAAAWQRFDASGRTLYDAGQESWGYWTVRGDEYCSQWPPNSAWACYGVDLDAETGSIRFRGRGDDVTIGTFRAE